MSANSPTNGDASHDAVSEVSNHGAVLDVSELQTTRVTRYAEEADDAYFERKGGRTFLVTDR